MSEARLRPLSLPGRSSRGRFGLARVTDPAPVTTTGSRAAEKTGRRFVVVHLVELKCLACGRGIGMLQAPSWPCFGSVLFQAVDNHSIIPVSDWRRLRCAVCGGNVYADEVRSIRVYPALSREDLDIPRRGRPPGWLVAQRHAALEGPED